VIIQPKEYIAIRILVVVLLWGTFSKVSYTTGRSALMTRGIRDSSTHINVSYHINERTSRVQGSPVLRALCFKALIVPSAVSSDGSALYMSLVYSLSIPFPTPYLLHSAETTLLLYITPMLLVFF